jgi:NDP-sugar pyrophosphorylase family protein
MNLILTMAGKYSRFTKEGYKIPKYLLPWGNHTILSEILKNFTKEYQFKNIYLIVNENDKNFFPHLNKIQEYYNISKNNLVIISDTKGQAETANIGISKIELVSKVEGPILFHNIDTILYNRNFKNIETSLLKNDGFIDLFKANNHEYSYVLLNNNYIKEISEKILISNLATSGMYGFSSIDIFKKYYSNNNFISEIYKGMIKDKLNIITDTIYAENETLVLGTPFEYFNLTNLNL